MSDKIEAGIYKGRGVEGSAQLNQNQNTGTETVAIDIELPQVGRTVTTFLYFTDKAEKQAIERLRALGWDGSDDFRGISANEVDVQVKYETYQGAEKMKVEIVTGAGRVVLRDTMNDQQKRGFMAKLQKLNSQAGGVSSTNGTAANTTKKMAL